jgi:O-antigen biosynthesis protein
MPQTIVIAGMHRSGTSLVSSLLQSAGVNIGEQLLGPNTCNPHGYFEDVAFLEFHERLLRERGQTYLFFDPGFTFVPTETDVKRAQQLISERSNRPLWGWKDPRTALFLSFWHQQLPEARFLFVYRHPLDVLLSLLRRGEFDSRPLPIAGLEAWQRYNASIKGICDQFPDRCLLVHIDGVVGQIGRFARLLQDKLQLDCHLDTDAFEAIYHANELKKSQFPLDATSVAASLFPAVFELYDQLNAFADIPPYITETSSTSLPNLQTLARFIETTSEPTTFSLRHSLLQLLLTLVAPEASERTLDRFYHNAKGAQVAIDYLSLQVQKLERINQAQDKKLHEPGNELQLQLQMREDQVQSQTIQIDQQVRQLQEQDHELKRQTGQIKTLLAELERVSGKRTWKLFPSYSKLKQRWEKKNSRRAA